MRQFISVLVLFISCNLFSQKAKLILGGGLSKINNSTFPILNKNVFVFSGGVGLDWLENDRYYISSELGYMQIGGKETNPSLPNPFKEMEKKWGFASLTSTFRYKLPISSTFFFIGAGPKINISLDSSSAFENTIYDGGLKMKTVNFGLNTELGYMHDWDNFRAGIIGSYLVGISPIADTEFTKLKGNPLYISLSFGVNL
ncbi:hypothetical protein PGH12_01400 [Chryseobacterium wangxinyae]|uniref:hypothetical protein n=1 Tax=Chryseobacterium sp. CY350 TaxID=2997336 RepID=UPI00226E6BC2|nr:hypothetical protein [Chryseobacterium sp. CY350]MCY0977163.1 hypothetical protein [Chryseobacterium sp. CY350]WBZ95816.1 hypothetical protein PGH12_01400 [Chryseobacterium sp. CY350]